MSRHKATAQSRATSRIVGRKVYQSRMRKRITQSDLAKQVGVSTQTIAKYEYGEVDIPTSRLVMLCEVLGISPNALFTECLEKIRQVSGIGWETVEIGEEGKRNAQNPHAVVSP